MKPTACTERNRTMEFCQMNRNISSPFDILGIRFFPEEGTPSTAMLRSQGYEWIIMDFGVLEKGIVPEFAACDIRLVILNGSPWKISIQESYFAHCLPDPEKTGPIILLGNPAPGQKLPRTSCLASFPVISVPYFENPFHLTSDTFSFFEKILTGV